MGECNPLLVRRGSCGIKKILAKPTLAPQTGWSLTRNVSVRATTPAAVAATPPHEEGTTSIARVPRFDLWLFRTDPTEAAVEKPKSIEIHELKLRVDFVAIHITIEH